MDELITELKVVVREETEATIDDVELQKRASGYAVGTDQDKFHYACGLIQHTDRANKEKGVQLLRALYSAIQKTSKYFTDADKDLARACLYYIAVGYYVLQNFKSAKEYGKILLDVTPNHQNCKALLALIAEAENPTYDAGQKGGKEKQKKGLFNFKKKEKNKKKEEKRDLKKDANDKKGKGKPDTKKDGEKQHDDEKVDGEHTDEHKKDGEKPDEKTKSEDKSDDKSDDKDDDDDDDGDEDEKDNDTDGKEDEEEGNEDGKEDSKQDYGKETGNSASGSEKNGEASAEDDETNS